MEELIIICAMAFSALFSGAEIAFASSNILKAEIQTNKEKDSRRLRILKTFNNHPDRYLTSMLIGNNVAMVIYSLYMGDLIASYISLDSTALLLIVQTLLSTAIILVFSEFLPKAFFHRNSYKMLVSLAPALYSVYFVLVRSYIVQILIKLSTKTGNFVLHRLTKHNDSASSDELISLESKDQDEQITDQLKEIIDEVGQYEGSKLRMKSKEERDNYDKILALATLSKKALSFRETSAKSAMVPRGRIVALPINSSIEEARLKFSETGLSRVILYDKDIDTIVGYAHALDIIRKKPAQLSEICREIYTFEETTPIYKVFREFVKSKKFIALVRDEYRTTSGIITLEDIVEELFGEIQDEHDTPENFYHNPETNAFATDASIEIDDLNEKLGANFFEPDEHYDTLAGLIVSYIDRIPSQGEIVYITHRDKRWKVKIQDSEKTHIKSVSFTPIYR